MVVRVLCQQANQVGAELWRKLAIAADDIYSPEREQVRQLVLDTFSRIVIYMRGLVPDRKARSINMLLVSRTGQQIWLEVDRRTGAWKAGRARRG